MSGAGIEFRFDSTDSESRFVREYLTDAWKRFETGDFFESGWFWPYGAFMGYESGPNGGFLRIVFEGDPDALVDAEETYWDGFDGLFDWHVRRYEEEGFDSLLAQQQDAKGEVAGKRDYRIKPLTTRFVLDYVREFSDPLSVIDDSAEANSLNYGYYVVIHYVMVQAGHDWYDETDACLRAMEGRVKSIAHYRGAEAAREEYNRLRAEWADFEEKVEEWIAEIPAGEAEVP